jgi:hypothetical protein
MKGIKQLKKHEEKERWQIKLVYSLKLGPLGNLVPPPEGKLHDLDNRLTDLAAGQAHTYCKPWTQHKDLVWQNSPVLEANIR